MITNLTIDQCIESFYIPYNKLGFEFKCVRHNHLSNNDDYMKIHLFQEHNIMIPLKNWHCWFTLYTVGDSYSHDYRCDLCSYTFMFEKEAFKHLESHGIKPTDNS
jgi:hypothetical protein